MTNPLFATPAYQALLAHAKTMANASVEDLFTTHTHRAHTFSVEAADLFLDYSKNLLDEEVLGLLVELADSVQLSQAIEQLFSGVKINSTEHRAALHTALRSNIKLPLLLEGEDVRPLVEKALEQMEQLCNKIHQKTWLGFSQKPITDIVNIGIGGSDLGPKMVVHALAPYQKAGVRCHFVSNIDGSHIHDVLLQLNPETTLFTLSSKTFTTAETLTNGATAKQWLLEHGANEKDLPLHFIAVTSNADKAMSFGVDPHHILPLWDWVGGRFSLWSAIGLPIALSIGMENFRALLRGAHQMDEHFQTQPLRTNMPVLLALMSFWYTQFFNAKTHAVLPYDYRLQHFVPYLQQLEMESNGKSIQHNGEPVDYATCPIIWGDVGTNGQHAFHQLLHQGTHLNPIDFIAAVNPHHPYTHQHEQLLAHCLAQSQALIKGRNEEEASQRLEEKGITEKEAKRLAPHLTMPGNQPHNIILMPQLTPEHLGALIALYEHKVFVLGMLWNINSFDQWGVELGKELATTLLPALQQEKPKQVPTTLSSVIAYYHQKRNK